MNELAGEGTDTVYAGVGYTFGANVEHLILTGTGNGLDNTISGNTGNNVLAGGAGVDTVSYANAAAGVAVSLGLTAAQATGGAGTDTMSGFENLVGSGFADTLRVEAGANRLWGGAGSDVFRFGRGDGADTVEDFRATAGEQDLIRFESGVALSEVILSREGDDLRVTLGSDRLGVKGYFLQDAATGGTVATLRTRDQVAAGFNYPPTAAAGTVTTASAPGRSGESTAEALPPAGRRP